MTECPDCKRMVTNEPSGAEYREMMETDRIRVLKALKISFWRQFEQGVLSELAVQMLVNVAEVVEDKPLAMIHEADFHKCLEIRGVFPWIRSNVLSKVKVDDVENTPEPPYLPYVKKINI